MTTRLAASIALALAGQMAATALPAQQPATVPAIDFGGVIYPQFRSTSDNATKNANGGKSTSKFDVERVYLNFRMPAGDDGSIRVTTDIFNNAGTCASCYAGWTVRLKYGYFNYNFLHDIGGQKGFNASARIGMLHTVVVDHEEGFFPRWISQVGLERNGFFSSSDVGIAGVLALPNKWGEAYATITNGTGYAAVEADPYKDISARVSLTPWGAEENILKTLTISPWIYMGKTASKFLTTTGSAGTDAASGLTKDRVGVFVGMKDRRLTAGVDFAQRTETVETGATLASRGTYDNSGKLTSVFALVRPTELFGDPKQHSKWGILARMDTFKPFSSTTAAAAQTTGATNQTMIYGLWWDLNQKASFSIDFQNLKPQSGSTTAESRVLFLHGQVSF